MKKIKNFLTRHKKNIDRFRLLSLIVGYGIAGFAFNPLPEYINFVFLVVGIYFVFHFKKR